MEKKNSRLQLSAVIAKQSAQDNLYKDLEKRIASSPIGTCPVALASACVKMCLAQSCGKCVPCRVGLSKVETLLDDILYGRANHRTLPLIEKLAADIEMTADCKIGTMGAALVRKFIETSRDDFMEHIEHHNCRSRAEGAIPCQSMCPARVDIPGYIALVNAGRYEDAVKLIRKDNPFPSACAYICEHPCENHCRRGLVDDAVNIRGLKRFAVDHAGEIETPKKYEKTGKTVAVLGAGPAGLSAAYYLSIMGHDVTVYEMREKLGGMLRYGIPEYRLPKKILDKEIDYILGTGVKVVTKTKIGRDLSYEEIRDAFDAVFVTVGAHTDKKLGISGENSKGVVSAIKLLGDIGDGDIPDYTGKNVIVVGGGNVAMDASRTSVRLGAKSVTCVYRRRVKDMTALPEEVQGAQAEGVVMKCLSAPVRIESDENGQATGLVIQPQIIGASDGKGRPAPRKANLPEEVIPADVIVVAIGQDQSTAAFEAGLPIRRGKFIYDQDCSIPNCPGIYVGGDCATGPATVIKAIAAGKTAAANIDQYLGYRHDITVDVDIPEPYTCDKDPCGRIEMEEAEKQEPLGFGCVECGMTEEAAKQESFRCLRCDRFGYGNFGGGRENKW